MNRFEITFPDIEKAAPAAGEARGTRVIVPLLPVECMVTALAATSLVTRRPIPGTSIRRLRHHRSPWPRRF